MTDEGLYYRYSVRCDRTGNHRIEVLAKATGVSPTTLVQQHFEKLLEEPKREAVAVEPIAVSHLSVMQARMLKVMTEAAENGVVTIGLRRLGDLCDMPYESARRILSILIQRGAIKEAPIGGKTKSYQILAGAE